MNPLDTVTIAILAKDKGHVLPLYLEMIRRQTFPKSRTKLYVRTNNNRDNTASVLEDWLEREGSAYSEVHYDHSDIPERVQDYAPHEWNHLRLKALGRLRQESVEWAKARGTHYFVADCDNFIVPDTIESLLDTNLPVVGPLLRDGDNPFGFYSNFHAAVDENGYFQNSDSYFWILYQTVRGLIQVDVIHCTYLVRNEVLDAVCYDDDSYRYEYVIFSDTLRKKGIPQYMDNRRCYGKLTFTDTEEAFKQGNFTPETIAT